MPLKCTKFLEGITGKHFTFPFQFTDRKCICQHGYTLKADGNTEACTKSVYEQCDEGTYRNQQGQCWTEEQWQDYCRNEVRLEVDGGLCHEDGSGNAGM